MNKYYIIFLTCLFTAVPIFADVHFYSSMNRYPADGQSSGMVRYFFDPSDNLKKAKGPFGDTSSIEIISKESSKNCEDIYFKSTGKQGSVYFEGSNGSKIQLTFYKTEQDVDEDGFPDDAELISEDDREAFRGWFIRVAESQFLKRSYSWQDTQRDCAGLIRFAYREALKKHDAQWLVKSGIVIDKNIPDIKRFNYPDVPHLGENIFKQKAGSAMDSASFGSFADAETLLKFNTVFVSRSISEAKKGDILFFRIISGGKEQYHSMIVAGRENGETVIIYHTGKGDVIKRVPFSYLNGSGAFSPSPANERFLGVYRFHILE